MTHLPDHPLSGLPGLLGITVTHLTPRRVEAVLVVEAAHLAPTGYLHAGTAVTLADTACGYGCLVSLPEGKSGFTTIELKTNHLATAKVGQQLHVIAAALHQGGTTQVWDAIVTATTPDDHTHGRQIAVFRCTQMLLESRGAPRPPSVTDHR
ncbi:MAG: PaaI family thioesterase [Actinomycetota bacterium]|nr:PaaI family thioesterase [Actinomycetota bacterium]